MLNNTIDLKSRVQQEYTLMSYMREKLKARRLQALSDKRVAQLVTSLRNTHANALFASLIKPAPWYKKRSPTMSFWKSLIANTAGKAVGILFGLLRKEKTSEQARAEAEKAFVDGAEEAAKHGVARAVKELEDRK